MKQATAHTTSPGIPNAAPDPDAMPWLASYDAGVPRTLAPYPARTLLDYIADGARERPDGAAILFKGARVSYGQLERLSDAFAAALTGLGVGQGDRVALLLPNCPQFIIAEVGAWKVGAVVAPLNPLYTARELAGPLADSGATVIVALTPFYERVKAIQPQTAIRRVIAANIKEFLPAHLRLLFTLLKERKEGHRVALQAGDVRFADLLRRHAGATRRTPPIGPDDPAVLLLSGGTTGKPKGVIGTHGGMVAAGLQLRAWASPPLVAWDDVIMQPLPLFHVYANVGTQSVGFIAHNPICLIPNPRDIDDVVKTIRAVRPAFLNGVPTLFNALLARPDVLAGKVDLRSIKLCSSGAAPLLAETKKRFEELTGGRIVEGYSLTEALMACAFSPARGASKTGSIGLPLPDVLLRVVAPDQDPAAPPDHAPLAPGAVGELIVHAPQIMPGYWRNPDETAAVLRPGADGRVWLHTGDLGYMDEEGYFFIVDRQKDLIKTSGYQVWPREIEEVIAAHPAVLEVGVAGVPHATKGEVAKAWVVLRPDQSATADELRAHCRAQLAPYKVPGAVEFRADLPKSLIGKVLRRALVAEGAGQAPPAEAAPDAQPAGATGSGD